MDASAGWMPLLLIVGGYLLGSIPFGIVVSKGLGLPDPRTVGSKNIGFTNVLRVSGKKAGVLTLIGDMGKGWLVGWLSVQAVTGEIWMLAAALSPILGHLFPICLKFKGGKGVATALGAVGGVAPLLGLSLIGIWLLIAATIRYSSGAALTAFTLFPILAFATDRSPAFLAFALAVSSLIVAKHRGNIVRLWAGTEPKIGQSNSLHNTYYQT
jgi:glycerol-3-phosphate acyltransferase PlsY